MRKRDNYAHENKSTAQEMFIIQSESLYIYAYLMNHGAIFHDTVIFAVILLAFPDYSLLGKFFKNEITIHLCPYTQFKNEKFCLCLDAVKLRDV